MPYALLKVKFNDQVKWNKLQSLHWTSLSHVVFYRKKIRNCKKNDYIRDKVGQFYVTLLI